MILILFLTSFSYAFTDTNRHWAKDTIDQYASYGIVKGYEDGSFLPNKYMTRAEVVTIINRMIGNTQESSKYIPDVKRQNWYASEIRKAIQSGFIQGDEKGYTRPNDLITREEAIVMLSRAFAIDEVDFTVYHFEDENQISKWAKKSVTTFANYRYLSGYTDGTIRPKANIKRAEFVTILHRIFDEVWNSGVYSGDISGSVLVMGKDVAMKDATIYNNLVIAEGVKQTFAFKNIRVNGNLILYEEIEGIDEIVVHGNIIELYAKEEVLEKYENQTYGIEFSIPKDVTVLEIFSGDEEDYTIPNSVIFNIEQDDSYYLQNIETIADRVVRKYDNIYTDAEKGTIGNHSYLLLDDLSGVVDNKCIIIKRDNTVYTLFFSNISADNLIDNILGTIKLTDGEKIKDRNFAIYKNNTLNLRFSYREGYFGIDDSYNTGNIYSGEAPLKLFIQVNIITDMQKYTLAEKKMMLKALTEKDGELLDVKDLQVFYNDAFQFKIRRDDEKIQDSLYIVIGNNLYNLILVADEGVMKEIGEEYFEEVVNSIEF